MERKLFIHKNNLLLMCDGATRWCVKALRTSTVSNVSGRTSKSAGDITVSTGQTPKGLCMYMTYKEMRKVTASVLIFVFIYITLMITEIKLIQLVGCKEEANGYGLFGGSGSGRYD